MNTQQYIHLSIEIWGCFFCLIAAVTVFITRDFDRKAARSLIKVIICCIALMASDGLWFFILTKPHLSLVVVKIAYLISVIMGLLVIPLVADYVSYIIYIRTGGIRIYWSTVEWVLFAIGCVLLIANEVHPYIYILDVDGSYIPLLFYFLPGAIIFTGLLITLVVSLVYIRWLEDVEKAAIITFLALPMISLAVRIFYKAFSYTNLTIVISVIVMFVAYEINYSNYMIQKEKQLNDERLRLINWQMQPHFIFNSLALIRYQCRHCPEDAIKTIDDFSVCMRNTTDFLKKNDCISVRQEVDFVKHYLNIQRKRFDESFDIEYYIMDEDFDVPAFSIQTLAENALHHGLNDGQTDEAKIIIKTEMRDGRHVVSVEDNGTGFDAGTSGGQNAGHAGLKNTESRLRIMCDGELLTESEAGAGTCVTMIIPE